MTRLTDLAILGRVVDTRLMFHVRPHIDAFRFSRSAHDDRAHASGFPVACGLRYGITKAGVMLEDLIEEDRRPHALFEDDSGERDRLMAAMDSVNGRFGKFSAVPASQGFKREWKARADAKSPNYTTRIAEVPKVRD